MNLCMFLASRGTLTGLLNKANSVFKTKAKVLMHLNFVSSNKQY